MTNADDINTTTERLEKSTKQDILQDYIAWINERVFANAHVLSSGVQPFAPAEFNNFYKLPIILKNNLSKHKQYHSRCLSFITRLHNSTITNINFEDLYIAIRLMEDELSELELDNSNNYNEYYQKYKPVLIARYNNPNFDNELAAILCNELTVTDAFFRYVLGNKLDGWQSQHIQENICYYINKHNTIDIINSLEDILIPEQVHRKFSTEVATLIEKSIKISAMKISFDSILQIDSITKILSDISSNTNDPVLNQLIAKAKEKWVKGEMFDSIRDLWDILERIKTILDENKLKGATQLIHNVCYSLYPNDEPAFKHTKQLFENEFMQLTDIGNQYIIRHTEKNTYDIHDKPELLKYFIKRVSPLLELFLKAIPT